MKIPSASEATSNERFMAAVAHAAVILFGWGVFAPILLWITQRQKSTFVTFHAFQALLYQLLQTAYTITAVVIGLPLMMSLQFGTLAMAASNERLMPVGMVLGQMLGMGCIFGLMGLYVLVGVAGAVLVLLRRDFQYPWIGGWMKRYLEQPPDVSALEI
jgi:uncharacterized Tic20 family protein